MVSVSRKIFIELFVEHTDFFVRIRQCLVQKRNLQGRYLFRYMKTWKSFEEQRKKMPIYIVITVPPRFHHSFLPLSFCILHSVTLFHHHHCDIRPIRWLPSVEFLFSVFCENPFLASPWYEHEFTLHFFYHLGENWEWKYSGHAFIFIIRFRLICEFIFILLFENKAFSF